MGAFYNDFSTTAPEFSIFSIAAGILYLHCCVMRARGFWVCFSP